MNKIWQKIGRGTFWVTWPFLYLYLRFSRRTRVLIVCGDEVLVVRGWLSNGQWSLPGGGLHRGESAVQGAVREVQEETGILLKPDQFIKLFDEPIVSQNGFKYICIGFVVYVKNKPATKRRKGELVAVEWHSKDEVADSPAVARVLDRIGANRD